MGSQQSKPLSNDADNVEKLHQRVRALQVDESDDGYKVEKGDAPRTLVLSHMTLQP